MNINYILYEFSSYIRLFILCIFIADLKVVLKVGLAETTDRRREIEMGIIDLLEFLSSFIVLRRIHPEQHIDSSIEPLESLLL